MYTNFNNLFDIGEVIKDDIGCLNGLKVLSLFTTILGHRIAFTIIFPKVNVAEFLNWGSSTRTGVSFWFQLNSVDNFLIIASLLATVKILKALDE